MFSSEISYKTLFIEDTNLFLLHKNIDELENLKWWLGQS